MDSESIGQSSRLLGEREAFSIKSETGKKGGSRKPSPAGRPAGVKIDPITGKPKGIDEV